MAKKFVRVGAPIQPNAAHVEIYREKFERYKHLRALLLQEMTRR